MADRRQPKRANGEAREYWNETRGRWEMLIELPPVAGKRRRKKVTGATKTEVRAKARAVRAELEAFGNVTDALVTVGDVLDGWMESLPGTVSVGTLEAYRRRVRLYVRPYMAHHKVKDLQPRQVSAWLRDLAEHPPSSESRRVGKLSAGTIRDARGVLVAALGWAEREGVVNRNVAAVTRGPAGRAPQVQPLDIDEVRTLLAAVEGWRYAAAVYLMAGLGLRVGETLGLKWGDIELDGDPPMLHVRRQLQRHDGGVLELVPTKTAGSQRAVALPAFVVAALRSHRLAMGTERLSLGAGRPGADDLVFTSTTGTPADNRNLARELRAIAEGAGLDHVHPHRLRHSAVAVLLDAGVPIETVSDVVGHSSIRVTKDTYGKLLDTGRARVAAAMDAAITSPASG